MGGSTRIPCLVVALLGTMLFCSYSASCFAQDLSIGQSALKHVASIVALGPRPPDSEAHKRVQRYIIQALEASGVTVEQIPFVAQTPIGPLAMNNIIGSVNGPSRRIIVLATHYDSKREARFQFVGANDGGSGIGLLLALAPLLAAKSWEQEVRLVFLDGEEPLVQWSESDSLYGSRHLKSRWKAGGELQRITAFILVDMIGDSDLGILRESNSTPRLLDQIWGIAERLGLSRHFLERGMAVEDDHIPFLREGVPAVDLIDFYYGPRGSFWHSAEDTLDKVSMDSLQVVGQVLMELLEDLSRPR